MFDFTIKAEVTAFPSPPDDSVGLQPSIDFDSEATYDAAWGASLPINGTDISPFVVNLGAVSAARAIAIRAVDNQSLVVRITSALGADQAIPVSDLFILKLDDASTTPITAIRIVGTGRIEYMVGGNR